MTNNEVSIVQVEDVSLNNTISSFEQTIVAYSERLGIPTSNIVLQPASRWTILDNLKTALIDLPLENRANTSYLSRFIVAIGAGLGDAALNYLWDETIKQLRAKVDKYGLEFFLDVITNDSKEREKVKSSDDLGIFTDNKFLDGLEKIGFLDNHAKKRLDNVRDLRNNASAAHPNANDLGTFTLLSSLEDCIKFAFMLEPDQQMMDTQRLLANTKKIAFLSESIEDYRSMINGLSENGITAVAKGFFNIYASERDNQVAKENIRQLFPTTWSVLPVVTKREIGETLGRYRRNGEEEMAVSGEELLQVVNGLSYINSDARSLKIISRLDELFNVHKGMNNFYNEPGSIEKLMEYIGPTEPIPESTELKFCEVLPAVFVTNGYGVCDAAEPYYKILFERLSSKQSERLLWYLTGKKFNTSIRHNNLTLRKYSEMLDLLSHRVASKNASQMIDLTLSTIGQSKEIFKSFHNEATIKGKRKELSRIPELID